jgi:hypothetical protein
LTQTFSAEFSKLLPRLDDNLDERYAAAPLCAARSGRRNALPKGISIQEGSCMSASRLRVYYGPEQVATEDSTTATIPLRETVSLPLGEVLPLLMDAVKNRRQWVGDFFDDEIMISSDLYEVLLAYQHFRRPSA